MRVSLWRSVSRLTSPVTAAHQLHAERPVLHLEVEHAGVAGRGEISPQPGPLNGDPGVDEVLEELTGSLLVRLARLFEREAEPPGWARTSALVSERGESRFAGALLEMALLDRELRFRGESASDLWPAQFDTPLQETVSLLDAPQSWSVSPRAARIRVKTAPGALTGPLIERVAGLVRPILLDYNASARDVAEVSSQVRALQEVAVLDALEQPFAPGNLVEMARLGEGLGVPLSIDEGLRSEADLAQIVRYGAAQVICVKPARVGGYARARSLIWRANDLGLRAYLGGFFETPYARGVNRVFAACCISEPSDVADVDLEPLGPDAAPGEGHGLGASVLPEGAQRVFEWS